MSDTNDTYTCQWCRHANKNGTVCRRYPPVPLLVHPAMMRPVRLNPPLIIVVVESAQPQTEPYNTCGEWEPVRIPDML